MLVKNISLKGTVLRIGNVEIHFLDIANKTVKVGIEAPRSHEITTDTYLRKDLHRKDLPPVYRTPAGKLDASDL